jgi:hypothetical protein
MPRKPLDERELLMLTTLRQLAVENEGWRWSGVRGWALGAEVSERAGDRGAIYRLPRLRAAGWAASVEVSDAGRPRNPVTLWRVTQAGEDELARLAGRAPAVLAVPRPSRADARTIFVGRRMWACLSELQRAEGPVPWPELERRVRERLEIWGRLDDLKLLINRGFAEREDRGAGREKVIWFSATPRGRAVRLVDGRTSETLVQLRVPAPRG